jgi:hypothetical protein
LATADTSTSLVRLYDIDANIGNQNGFVFPTAGGLMAGVSAVPEPTGLSVAVGGVALLTRRRRKRSD